MKIKVNIQDPALMRYESLGDYFYVKFNDTLTFDIVDTGDDVMNKLILIHELVEELLTRHNGITEEEITEWDKEHPDDDPGSLEDAPYHKEHMLATEVEQFICQSINLGWDEYENRLDDVADQVHMVFSKKIVKG